MFYLLKEHNGANNVGDFVKIMASAGTYRLGAVVTAAGALATGDAKAEYVCMEEKTIPGTGAPAPLYVLPVSDDMVFETTYTGTGTTSVGTAYKFNDKGTGITFNKGAETDNAETATGNNGAIVLEAPEGGKVRVKLKN